MSKKKKTYGLILALNIIALIAVGYFLYARAAMLFFDLPVEIRLKPVPIPVKTSPGRTEKKEPPKESQRKAIKTTFTYDASKAKSVSVSGSFSKWQPIEMEKKNGKWTKDIWIFPGKYIFHYTVDGEKKLAPDLPMANIGESIVEIKEGEEARSLPH